MDFRPPKFGGSSRLRALLDHLVRVATRPSLHKKGKLLSAHESGTTVESLLAALASRAHGDRMRLMVDYGRLSIMTDPAGALRHDVLCRLERGDVYERLLALQSCQGSRDGARVLRVLSDPSRTLRSRALWLASLVCDDEELARAFDIVPRRHRIFALRGAVKRGRGASVDAFLAALESADDPSFLDFLPYGSEAFVSSRLQRATAEAGMVVWARLGRRHSRATAWELIRSARADETDPQRVERVEAMLPHLAVQAPDVALQLLKTLDRRLPLTLGGLGDLAARRPGPMADLVLSRPDDLAPQTLLVHLAGRLGDDEARLAAVTARLGAAVAQAPTWLRRHRPQARRVAFAVAALAWRDHEGVLPPRIVALLPGSERGAEARRHWRLPALQTRPRQQLLYAGLLPYEEACELVAPFLHNPDAELRADALSALTESVRYSRHHLPDLLALVVARGKEQDPVRLAMLAGLAALPPSIFTEAHLGQLTVILREAMNASDLSPKTTQAMERLAVRLIARQPSWAVSALTTLMRERGSLSGPLAQFTDDDVRRLAPSAWPVIRAWSKREREHQIVAFASLIKARLGVWDELVGTLAALVVSSRNAGISLRALRMIAEHRPDRLAALVPDLLRQDPSWITQPIVQAHLHHRRQDLLDPFLGRQAWQGRFSTGRTRYVLPFRRGFERWRPDQQRVFACALGEIIDDAERDTPAVLSAIDQLGALPAVLPDQLISLAASDATRVAARDRALQALARRDSGDGLDTLIVALGDERARVAVYALRGALADAPETRVVSLLRRAPRDRVTVAKEVVRLAGEQPGEKAHVFLLELDEESSKDGREGAGLHRDVRVALLRALWGHLEKVATWPILQRAATGADPVIATSLARISAPRLTREADARLSELFASLLKRPEPTVRLDVLKRLFVMPPGDAQGTLTDPILRCLRSELPDEIAAAAALVKTRAGRRPDALQGAVRDMLPNRRALRALTNTLVKWLSTSRVDAGAAAGAVIDGMASDPLTVGLRLEIALAALTGPRLVQTLAELAGQNALNADVLAQVVGHLNGGLARREEAVLAALNEGLGSRPEDDLRRLALAALVGLGRRLGWNDDRVAQLQQWRGDPSPMVAEAAQFTFVTS